MQKTLILWDIDGTILHSGGAGMKALQEALKEAFGVSESLASIDFAGRTDPWIIRRIFALLGLEDTPENHARCVDAYIALLPKILGSSGGQVLPGVRQLLDEAAVRPNVVQGLLTGNLRRGAQTKLGYHGLWDYFPIGAFADDSEIRNELGPHALRRAKAHWNHDFTPDRVWIIGDTPHDIACARAFGAKALAVATGGSTLSVLAGHKPDAVAENLSDARAFWRAIGA